MPVSIDARCTGCGACEAACPVSCIRMQDDIDGFSYPHIDYALCISCGKCERVCPLNSREVSLPSVSFAFCSSEAERLSKCASGGAFSELALSFLDSGGVVVGVADRIDNGSEFVICENEAAIASLSGSKYYQCNLSLSILEQIKRCLNGGKEVLFCGTPCQVQSVKNTVPKSLHDKLLLVDIICQGVPSRLSVSTYRDYMSRKYASKLTEHRFRAKLTGYEGEYVSSFRFSNGESLTRVGAEDLYARAFMYQVSLRESCYSCPFACMERAGDLTLGDFWAPNLDDLFKRGSTSLVLVNTEKGRLAFDRLQHRGLLREVSVEQSTANNIPLHSPVKRPIARSFFYHLMRRVGFAWAATLCCWRYPAKRLISKLRK